MKPIISVEGLGKSYTIRHEGQTRYKSLREEIFKLPQRLLRQNGQSQEEFWALKDVSFDVMPGERVGIIGRNGAGKSTLLKLLSRITEPTTGRITLRGRVASLLEVGTGFHPELTGRENIFLNGAILGMSRSEVRRKFDEIVDFAGVEKFLDTPVKRYSSGMYVRLAFAVAAHLEPEILIVDEVLAVGDAEFQKKCLGKMEDVSKSGGRTVLFVSHNMDAVSTLCNMAIVLNKGRIVFSGRAADGIKRYTEEAGSNWSLDNCLQRGGSGGARFEGVEVLNSKGEAGKPCQSQAPCTIRLRARILSPNLAKHAFALGVGIENLQGRRLATCNSAWVGKIQQPTSDFLEMHCQIRSLPLVPGKYALSVGLTTSLETLDYAGQCCTFDVLPNPGQTHLGGGPEHGEVALSYDFWSGNVHERS